MQTRMVYWKGKFDGRAVTINADAFDPAIHSDSPWKAEKAKGEKDADDKGEKAKK